MAMRTVFLVLVFVGCSATPSGPDGGSDCHGAPSGATCRSVAAFTQCGASFEATLAARTLDCDASPGVDGYVGVGACEGLRSIAWNTSTTGETAECFYANDGGALVGALQFTDRGVVLAGGQVASCTREAPSSCQGPTCIGAPSTAMCVDGAGFTQCRASAALTLSEHAADCDAGAGIVGYVAQGDCGELESVTWTYGFPGDTMECFYERDGGVFTGGLNFTDRGVLASGRVASCTYQPTASCR